MKNTITILSLGMILAACTPTKPAPYELRGGEFYGKGNEQSRSSREDFVYKGKSGDSDDDKPYSSSSSYETPSQHSGRSSSDIVKKPLDSSDSPRLSATTSKIDDSIDQYEDSNRYAEGKRYNSSRTAVPTSRDDISRDNSLSEVPDSKPKNSDYLDLSSVESRPYKKPGSEDPKQYAKLETRPEPKAPTYTGERNDKLIGISPKEKPHMDEDEHDSDEQEEKEVEKKSDEKSEEKSSETSSVTNKMADLNITAKDKPQSLLEERDEAKPEPAAEAKPEPKPEKKQVAKAEPEEDEAELNDKPGFVKVPEHPPVAKAEVKKPEIKKVEEAKKEEPKKIEEVKKEEHKKLEVVSTEEAPEVVKKQDIATIPKLETAPANNGPVKFIKPTEGKIIKEFGDGNDGVTIQAAEGAPVKAAAGGEVVYSGNQLQGYGNMIVIKHPNGFLTAYSHLDGLDLKKGTKVGQGEVIGKVGKSGNVSSPQLHFGVRKGRSAVNPRDYL